MWLKQVFSKMIWKTKITIFILSFTAAVMYYLLLSDTNWHLSFQPSLLEQNNLFLINTPGCRIPYIDHFHQSVKAFYKRTEGHPTDCKDLNLLVVKNNKIFLDENRFLRHFGNVSLNCVYSEIIRNPQQSSVNADRNYGFGKSKSLKFGQEINEEHIKVQCYSHKRVLFEEFVPLLLLKSEVEKRCLNRSELLSPERLNVVMIALDSVSKLNFLRHFNQTCNYLRNTLNAFEFHGHTKVADNTFVNMVPMLTGHFHNFYRTQADLRTKYLDDLDLIWKEYSSVGYRTFYMEDSPNIGTFTYMKHGFRYPPTDYYLRPFTIAVHEKTPYRYGCFGTKPEARFLNDYLLRFARLMDRRPFFALLFHSHLTHDALNHAGYMDMPMLDMLQQLHESGILNKTLLFFFSDHGIRFGKIRETYVGKIEERMPFMFLLLPRWFLNAHPVISRNLEINQKRLTTPFDVYQTLVNTLSIASSKNIKRNESLGISLFEEIPPERTCDDAGILPHWCTCHQHVKVSTSDSTVQRAAKFMIKTINDWMNINSGLSPCVKLHMEKIVDARISVPYQFLLEVTDIPSAIDKRSEHLKSKIGVYHDYLITLTASPSNALLEGTLRYEHKKFKLLDVSRINMYGNQSYCIQDHTLRKFCYCKSFLTHTSPHS